MIRIVFLFIFLISIAFSQVAETIRGTITDEFTEATIEDVQVYVKNSYYETRSNGVGEFRLENIPVGRYDIVFSKDGYKGFTLPGVLVTAAKELILTISLTPKTYETEEVVLESKERGKPANSLALLSTIAFEADDMRKFAGGLDDPTRLMTNFPGVNGNGFISDNFISVRANSPRGLKYMVEGVEIPNPNHFARIGSSGGIFTIFSPQILGTSDFFTGAWPAEYGDATAGIFDIHFRNGNNQKREYALQASILGVDLAAEGPFKKGGKASYLINYRFSTLTVANLIINYLTLPEFQDISFKLNFPTKKAGTFGVFGIGGLSSRLREEERDPALWEEDLDRFRLNLNSNMAATGVTHRILIGKKSVLKSVFASTFSRQTDNREYLQNDSSLLLRDRNEYNRQPLSFASQFTHVFSNKHLNKTGVRLTSTNHNHWVQDYDYVEDSLQTLVQEKGRTYRIQAYTQSQFVFGRLKMVLGAHLLHYSLNNETSIEPRLALRYKLGGSHEIGAGFGMYSQTEDFASYSLRNGNEQPNLNLGFIQSRHYLIGYYGRWFENHRVRMELYYQDVYNVPVEPGTSFSVLNLNELDRIRVLENTGTGRNMGVDFGLERFTDDGLYYLINASVYDSKYTGGDGVERSTAFDARYKVNFLLGKEWRVGKSDINFLGMNATVSALGGQRFTPLDLAASRAARETVPDENLAWSMQEQPLVVLDFTLTLRRNKPNKSGVWAFQIKNLLQNALPEYREYDVLVDAEVTQRGAALLPIISYKVEF